MSGTTPGPAGAAAGTTGAASSSGTSNAVQASKPGENAISSSATAGSNTIAAGPSVGGAASNAGNTSNAAGPTAGTSAAGQAQPAVPPASSSNTVNASTTAKTISPGLAHLRAVEAQLAKQSNAPADVKARAIAADRAVHEQNILAQRRNVGDAGLAALGISQPRPAANQPTAPPASTATTAAAQTSSRPSSATPQQAASLHAAISASMKGDIPTNGSAAAMRPLNVKDALSYLDQVKLSFEKEPDVYNRFLDIMKDFKLHVIDTPGVIDRVSSLFRNQPSLISGFNTFLPEGYRLVAPLDPKDTTITVITPSGVQRFPAGFSAKIRPTTNASGKPGSTTDNIFGQPVADPAAGRSATAAVTSTAAASSNREPAAAKERAAATSTASAQSGKQAASGSASQAASGAAQPAKSTTGAIETARASAQTSRNNTPNAANAASDNKQTSSTSSRPPIEFNHAISYVNKIKNRYSDEPDIYKKFLEILQTYQKEQRQIQDVYVEVTKLFKDAPDLLDEFKQFLPDNSQSSDTRPRQSKPAAPAADDAAASLKRKRADNSTAQPSQSSSRAPAGGMTQGAADTSATAAAKNRTARRAGAGKATGYKDPAYPAQPSSMRQELQPTHNGMPPTGPPAYIQPILSYLPAGYVLPGNGGNGNMMQPRPPVNAESPEERQFFDRVADFIDDKYTYYEFLKLLNLFTQDIIDLPTLVSRAWLFLGSAQDLWVDFREIVGWRDGSTPGGRNIENGEWIVENIPAQERKNAIDHKRLESCGPSYRRLPQSEINKHCSGRDGLCWEVLNDEWVSVMSLGSEEVFVAHRKNVFEEALHRTEDERHEYDFHIEANLRTIALLEPVAARIIAMEPAERLHYKLRSGLGGQSRSIYQRVIKKVYGRDVGREIVQALHDNPCVTVPIVLARLKQKDEEWKRALREWNRVWREVDAKNFYRSLDHQGINFKLQDKRYLSSKSLVSDIENLRRIDLQRQFSAPAAIRPTPATYQLAFPISDENCLFDTIKLFLSYLDRAPGYHTVAERDRIEAFLRSLTSLVFAIPVPVLDSMLSPVKDDSASRATSDIDDGGMSDSAASATDFGRGANGDTLDAPPKGVLRKAADLRKKALDKNGRPASRAVSAEADSMMAAFAPPKSAAPADSAPAVATAQSSSNEDMDVDAPAAEASTSAVQSEAAPANMPTQNARAASDAPKGPASATPSVNSGEVTPALHFAGEGALQLRRFNFFCNTPYYCAIRLLHLLYSRLRTMKEAASALDAGEEVRPQMQNSVYTTFGKSVPKTKTIEAAVPASSIYDSMLELCEKLFSSDIDQGAFEESVRDLFGNQGYLIFTVDKLLSALVRTVWSLIDANREAYGANGEIFKLLVDDRRHPSTAQAQQVSYRLNAELAAGSDENLYRIEWMPRRHLLTFQLLGKDEILPEDESDLSHAWERYISSYLADDVTKGLLVSHADVAKHVAIKRNLATSTTPDARASSALESRICMRSYKMFWQKGTEDYMHVSREDKGDLQATKDSRKQRWRTWLDSRPRLATPAPVPSVKEPSPVVEKQESGDEAGDSVMKSNDATVPAAAESGPAVPAPTEQDTGKEVDAASAPNDETATNAKDVAGPSQEPAADTTVTTATASEDVSMTT